MNRPPGQPVRPVMNITPTVSPLRSRVIHLADAQSRIPGPAGEHALRLMQRGTLDVALSIPQRPIPQSPHEQDELYVIIRGRGVLFHDGKRDPFEAGDLLFVAAGIEHQFEEISDDLAVWRIFYGAGGGEIPER
ncbi:MAG TPA: cupin domain-containing protein [Tepidisphaeraceae bacterium]|nr:cupin domain-containing protein [Tepidisphaeraceae bacterium]